MRTIVWYRAKDLRVADHAPLIDAASLGEVIPLFIMNPRYFDRASELPHRMQFLLQCLQSLKDNLEHRGSTLVLSKGPSRSLLPELVQRWGVDRVVAHRGTEPFGRERDAYVAQKLSIPFDLFEGETLAPPGSLRSKAGTPFSVFSPFARAFRAQAAIEAPLPAPERLSAVPDSVLRSSLAIPTLEALGLSANPRILAGGEREARQRLWSFLRYGAEDYHKQRDRMDIAGTSRLSQDLKFGTLSIRTVWHQASKATREADPKDRFLNELLWREFAHHMLWDRPELLTSSFRPEFRDFPWEYDQDSWQAWADGKTGYPIVDAAARQLRAEGFVHNRARMIAASFLTKHLLIDYRLGEAHYLRLLTDGDWSQNNAGWQWSAGSGCDAQPYFRIFNPMTQGEKFDPNGDYVRRWVPELKEMSAKFIHRPWEAPAEVLESAGITLGETYPAPIVDHKEARRRFLFVAEQHIATTKSRHKPQPTPASSHSPATRPLS